MSDQTTTSTSITTPLDRLDIGGWLLLLLGGTVVAATVLAPAQLELQRLSHQQLILEHQARALTEKRDNYRALIAAIDADDQRLIQRLAWRELNLKPLGAEIADGIALADFDRGSPLDEWASPQHDPSALPTPDPAYPDSLLTRLLTGSPAPWVMGGGVYLMMLGVLLAPMRSRRGREHADPLPVES